MPQKPKARGSKSKIKSEGRSEREPQKSQSERFIETARAIGVDETGKEFDGALRKLITPRKRPVSGAS